MIYQKSPVEQEFREENLNPFDEIIISWNALRPTFGKFLFYLSIKTQEWSPYAFYASWGSDGQSSILKTDKRPTTTVLDLLKVMQGKKATAFQIKILIDGSASLTHIHGLYVYTNGDRAKESQKTDSAFDSVLLKVPGLSQMTVAHPRHPELCSPTATTIVTRYLSNNTIDPVHFAEQVWDSGCNTFGTWSFSIAQASTYLGDTWHCWVERLHGFEKIHHHLTVGNPVAALVRGPLPGGARPYAKGHLITVTGYDASNQKVLCVDPAFPQDHETQVSYDLNDFIQAWNRRGNLAYVFSKKITCLTKTDDVPIQ